MTRRNRNLTALGKPADSYSYEWLSEQVCISPDFEYRDTGGQIKTGAAFVGDSGPIPMATFRSMLAQGFRPDDPDDASWLQ